MKAVLFEEPFIVRLRERSGQLRREPCQLSLRLESGDPGRQPRDRRIHVIVVERTGRAEAHRNPDIGMRGNWTAAVLGQVQVGRQHADDFIRLLVQLQRLPDDAAIAAERTPPEPVRQDGAGRRARHVVSIAEQPSDGGPSPQEAKHAGIGEHRDGALRLRSHGDVAALGPVDPDLGERLRVLAEVEVLGGGHLPLFARSDPGHLVLQAHQPAGFGVRQPVQHDAFEQREDRGARAHAERQGEHGGRSEAGALEEPAQRVAEVLDHSYLRATIGSTRAARRAGR